MSEQKVALITGGALVIARAVTLALAARGWSVAICYRTSAKEAGEVMDTVKQAGAKGMALQIDVSDPNAAAGLVRKVRQEWGFFFQAEDGIRDGTVTGVQTCALPIWRRRRPGPARRSGRRSSPASRPGRHSEHRGS